MSGMRKFLPLSLVVILLAGCSPVPDRADVIERLTIELEAPFGDAGRGNFDAVAEGLADDALDGMCGSDAYRTQLDGSLLVAWDSTCLAHFGHDMSAAQIDTAKESVELD